MNRTSCGLCDFDDNPKSSNYRLLIRSMASFNSNYNAICNQFQPGIQNLSGTIQQFFAFLSYEIMLVQVKVQLFELVFVSVYHLTMSLNAYSICCCILLDGDKGNKPRGFRCQRQIATVRSHDFGHVLQLCDCYVRPQTHFFIYTCNRQFLHVRPNLFLLFPYITVGKVIVHNSTMCSRFCKLLLEV